MLNAHLIELRQLSTNQIILKLSNIDFTRLLNFLWQITDKQPLSVKELTIKTITKGLTDATIIIQVEKD